MYRYLAVLSSRYCPRSVPISKKSIPIRAAVCRQGGPRLRRSQDWQFPPASTWWSYFVGARCPSLLISFPPSGVWSVSLLVETTGLLVAVQWWHCSFASLPAPSPSSPSCPVVQGAVWCETNAVFDAVFHAETQR